MNKKNVLKLKEEEKQKIENDFELIRDLPDDGSLLNLTRKGMPAKLPKTGEWNPKLTRSVVIVKGFNKESVRVEVLAQEIETTDIRHLTRESFKEDLRKREPRSNLITIKYSFIAEWDHFEIKKAPFIISYEYISQKLKRKVGWLD